MRVFTAPIICHLCSSAHSTVPLKSNDRRHVYVPAKRTPLLPGTQLIYTDKLILLCECPSWQHPAVCKPRAAARTTPALTSNVAIVVDWRPTRTRVRQHCITFLRTVTVSAIRTVFTDNNVNGDTKDSYFLTGDGGCSQTHFVYGRDAPCYGLLRNEPQATSATCCIKKQQEPLFRVFSHYTRDFFMECTATDVQLSRFITFTQCQGRLSPSLSSL